MSLALDGKRVVITRAKHQAQDLARELEARGAVPIELPLISIAEPSDGGRSLRERLECLKEYDWIVFSSRNAVDAVALLHDISAWPETTSVAVIGTSTAHAVADFGWHTDFTPQGFGSAAFVSEFSSGTGRVLIPSSEIAMSTLSDGLRNKGWIVDVAPAYRTTSVASEPELRSHIRTADAVIFMSPSAVTNFIDTYGILPTMPTVACIGPTTASAAKRLGLHVDGTASEATVLGVLEALEKYYLK